MLLTTPLLLAAAFALNTASTPVRRCSILYPLLPDENHTRAILRATSDSAPDGEWFEGPGEWRASRVRPNARSVPMKPFGQIFELRDAYGVGAGSVKQYKRAVVVWWSGGCGREVPAHAIRIPHGDLFLSQAARPQREWIDGIPTFDVDAPTWFYAPSDVQPGFANNMMTIAEYSGYFATLPRARDVLLAVQNGGTPFHPLLDWAKHNRKLSTKYPAKEMLCKLNGLLHTQDKLEYGKLQLVGCPPQTE